MAKITVDFATNVGKVKPMHAVNNGPAHKFAVDQRISNLQAFIDAGIPYARNHDASFYATYGGNHTVDVNFIFTDWSKDPYDPASYDFVCTDELMRVYEAAGVKPFYRLGSRIEHEIKKYNTLPPPDFKKWAIVCEHIIRHYNEGWADGMHMDIEYWEIWNEPNLDPDDSNHKRCWGGTAKQFYELFRITLEHLKEKFPHLKIGGPSCASIVGERREEWVHGLFQSLGDVKPDFFSWHIYSKDVEWIKELIYKAQGYLKKYNLTKTESILNEWNYVRGWTGDEWIYSLKTEKNLKGSAFIASTMLMSQYEPLDMLMYYDARPCGMNGMFKTDMVCEKLKGYYPFYMFNQLYKLDHAVKVERDDINVYVAGAVGDEQNVMLSYFNDDDNLGDKEVKVEFKNVANDGKVKLEYYVLDENHDCELVREEIFTSTEFSAYIKLPIYTTMLLKIVKA